MLCNNCSDFVWLNIETEPVYRGFIFFFFFLVAVLISYTAKHEPTSLICRISVCTPGHGWAVA